MHVQFVGGESTEPTVDSGAEESVCPWEWGHQFGTKVSRAEMKLKNASGRQVLVRSMDLEINPVEWGERTGNELEEEEEDVEIPE
eukprot:4254654-Karenia_brevis.AAC.1